MEAKRDTTMEVKSSQHSSSEVLSKSTDTPSEKNLNIKKSSVSNVCRICLSSILDPASLVCGHTFCEKCLNQYWNIRDRPDYIICPLCRNCAFDVTFAEKEEFESTEDFRKTFNPLEYSDAQDLSSTRLLWVKISVMIAAVYYIIKWGRPLYDIALTFIRKIQY